MHFIWVLALCIFCGLSFAGLATWLMTRRGNTIKDILQSSQFKDAQALSLEIKDKIKISSNIPIVALYIVAALVAVGLPTYLSYQLAQPTADVSVLVGRIKDYRQVVNPAQGEKVYAFFPEMSVRGDGSFDIPLRSTEGVQNVVFEAPNANPITLNLVVRPREGSVKVNFESFGGSELTVVLEGKVARLPGPLLMSRALPVAAAAAAVVSQPSVPPRISNEFENVGPFPETVRGNP